MKNNSNVEIRQAICESKLFYWQVAKHIGVSDSTLCRWFRDELTPEKKEVILNAIQELTAHERDQREGR